MPKIPLGNRGATVGQLWEASYHGIMRSFLAARSARYSAPLMSGNTIPVIACSLIDGTIHSKGGSIAVFSP